MGKPATVERSNVGSCALCVTLLGGAGLRLRPVGAGLVAAGVRSARSLPPDAPAEQGNLGIGMLDLTNYLIHFPNLMSMFGVAVYSSILVFVVALGAVIYFTHCKAAEPSGGHRRRRRRSPVQRDPAVRTAPVERE